MGSGLVSLTVLSPVTGLHIFFSLSCLHRVEAQASLGGGGPEVLVSQEEPDAEEPEARME